MGGLFVQHRRRKLLAEGSGVFQVLFGGHELDPQGRQRQVKAQRPHPLQQVGRRFAAPGIGAEGAGEFAPVDHGVQAQQHLIDRGQSVADQSGGAQQQAVGGGDRGGGLGLVVGYQVKGLDVLDSSLLQALADGLGQPAGVAEAET